MKKLGSIGTVLALAVAVACSEPETELPECADYRQAEISSLLDLKRADANLESSNERLEEAVREAQNVARLLGAGTVEELIEQYGDYDSFRDLDIIDAMRFHKRAESLQTASRQAHEEAVAVRASQGCSAPKPVFKEKE